MPYRILADLVLVTHLAFVAFVIFGGVLVLRRRQIAWLHLPAVVWGAIVEFAGWVCPLTPLENRLREAGGGASYSSDFIEHYVTPVLYPTTLTREDQLIYGLALVVVNGAIYGFVLYRAR